MWLDDNDPDNNRPAPKNSFPVDVTESCPSGTPPSDAADHLLTHRDQILLQGLLASMSCAAVVQDLYGLMLAMTPAMESMAQLPPGGGIGRNANEFCPPDKLEELRNVAARVRGGETVISEHTIRVRYDDVAKPVSFRADPLRDADGRVVGIVKVFRLLD